MTLRSSSASYKYFVVCVRFVNVNLFFYQNAYEDNNEKPPLKLIVDKDEDYYENNYVNEEDNYLDVTYDDLTDDLADTTNKSNSESKQLSKLLKDLRTKLEAINERKKREILSATSDGVIIKSESYADFKRKNLTKTTPGILR